MAEDKTGSGQNQEHEAFYKKLHTQLEESAKWPARYMYKFIVPTEMNNVKDVDTIFDNMGAVMQTRLSKNGKYTSITIEVVMRNPAHVIEKYKEVALLEGVIML